MIAELLRIKLIIQKYLPKRAATYHALDAALSIAGWDLAEEMGSDVNLPAKVKSVYMEAMGVNKKG